jgi:uncharacterized protein (TIGR04255 family)
MPTRTETGVSRKSPEAIRGVAPTEPTARESWLADIPQPVRPGRHYERAPIVEAVIEIRCAPTDPEDLDSLPAAVDTSLFTSSEQVYEVQGKIDLGEAGPTGKTTLEPIGFRFSTGEQAVQVLRTGFSYSWLGQYRDWSFLFSQAEKNWFRYLAAVKPTRATRVGVRFINKIKVPNPSIEIRDYLRIGVDVPAYLPQEIASYFLRVEIPLPKLSAVVTISSGVQDPRPDGTVLVLDIDAWRPVDIDLSDESDRRSLDVLLEDLRLAKNFAFESSITDATRGLIE